MTRRITTALLLALLVSASAVASPRSAAQPVTGFVRLLPSMDGAGPSSPSTNRTGPASTGVSPDPQTPPANDISTAAIGGLATWYCGGGSPCTHGYGPSDLVAAIDPTLGIRKGTELVVHYRSRSVSVRVVDVCACAGARIIDLTSGAFSRLAPLSAGVIRVSIDVGGHGPAPELTLPPTDVEP